MTGTCALCGASLSPPPPRPTKDGIVVCPGVVSVVMEAAPVRDQPASSSEPYAYCVKCFVQGLPKKPTEGE